MLAQSRQRHLMGAPGAFHRLAVDDLGAGPALRRAQTIIGQQRRSEAPCSARSAWIRRDLRMGFIQRGGQRLMHRVGSSPETKIGR